MFFVRRRSIFVLVSRILHSKVSRSLIERPEFFSLPPVHSRFSTIPSSNLASHERPVVSGNTVDNAFTLLQEAERNRLNIRLMNSANQSEYFDKLWAKMITG